MLALDLSLITIRSGTGGAVHCAAQPELEVPVQGLPPQRHPVHEHVDAHEAERLPVHAEPVGVDGREAVAAAHAQQPVPDVVAGPVAGVWKDDKN